MRNLIPILVILMAGCGPVISVYHDYDRSLDFKSYQTFDWKMDLSVESKQNPLYYNELTDKRVRTAVNETLLQKGYNKASEPDFEIHYHIMVEDKSVAAIDPSSHNYNAYWLGTELSTYQYKEGTLIIDLMDGRSNTLMWRGWAVAILEDLRPEVVDKKLKKTVERILATLPDASHK